MSDEQFEASRRHNEANGPPGNANRSPSFKNTLTLPELVQLLVKHDAPDKDRAHAALALQYLSLNIDKVHAFD